MAPDRNDYLAEIRLQTDKIERFPDNPITVDENPATGKLQYDLEDATPKHAMEILAYRDSLRPAGRVGRPRGSEKPKKSGRATLDPELALRMYQAKLDAPKWSWQRAARGVLGASIPSDLKARERLRQKIARLLALGAGLHHKKSVR